MVPRTIRSLVVRTAVVLLSAAAILVPAAGSTQPVAAAALPTISVGDVTVTEGTGGTVTAVFTVTQDIKGKSTVSFKTADDTAKAPADYVARSGKIRFAGKKLTRTVSVTVIGDAMDEPDETFFLELTGAKGATIADGHGVGTITDNDAPPTVSIASSDSVPEGQAADTSFASLHVTLSAASGKQVSVDWATADGTATAAGNDYTPDSGTVEFARGETDKTVQVAVIGDTSAEGDETFDVTLSSPVDATLGNATDTVTILDNDPIPPGDAVFSVTGVAKREGASGTTTFTFTVTRSGETTTAVDVDYATGDGTAMAPTDYASASGNLAFVAAQTTQTVDVTVSGDRTLEHAETFFLTLENPSAGASIATGQATGTIKNDDTRTTAVVRVRAARHRVSVHGLVSPARKGGHVGVRLFRKRNGSWVRIRSKHPALRGAKDVNGDGFTDSRYATTFRRPAHGRCKAVATYSGDAQHARSSATKLFRC